MVLECVLHGFRRVVGIWAWYGYHPTDWSPRCYREGGSMSEHWTALANDGRTDVTGGPWGLDVERQILSFVEESMHLFL